MTQLRSLLARWTAKLAVRFHPHLMLKSQSLGQTPAYMEDGLATMHNCDFLTSPRFKRAYAAGKSTGSWFEHDLRWRIHVLLWSASWAIRLPGAFVECGVHRGGFAKAIIDYTNFGSLGRSYHLFDTFKGFDSSQLQANELHMLEAFQYEECFAEVQASFADQPFVRLVRGTVPATLEDVGPVAFLSIDMNCAAPEIAAARHFWPSLLPGAVVVLDDYGFELHHAQKLAFDELAQEWGIEILSLPTGQGLFFKPLN